jgi:UDP-N-acetylmuramoylalanine--D-glutamate ligase
MDRYRSFYEYFNEKLKVFANQGKDDFLVLNYDAENLRRLKGLAQSKALFYAKESPPVSGYRIAAFTREGKIYCSHDGAVREIMPVSDIKLSGVHNLENVLASCLASTLADVEPGFIRSAVSGFTGLEHRFETVGTIDGVEYIDDSKGTTVDSTRRALESCTKPVVLIAGGKDKKSDYSKIRDAVADRVSHLVLIGEAANAIKKAVGGLAPTDMAKTMKEAVETGRRVAKDGWIVLLSPMCSSFDMYKNYKERGDDFRRAVESLKSGQHTVKS